jgi:hypothetical protein
MRYFIFYMLTASDIDNSQATTTSIPIRWNEDGEKALRGKWGKGSASTQKRARRAQREFKATALQSHSIVDMFQRQRDIQLRINGAESSEIVTEENVFNSTPSSPPLNDLDEAYRAATAKLSKLLQRQTEQKRVYGSAIDPKSSFYLRHRMVLSFL